jgi:hypothetical protein
VPTFWYCPFLLDPSTESRLLAAGFRPHIGPADSLAEGSLLVYDAPDRVLELLRSREPVPSTDCQLAERYQRLARMTHSHRLISCWCLSQLSPQQLEDCSLNLDKLSSISLSDCSRHISVERPPVAALTAAVLLSLLSVSSHCIDVYIHLDTLSERFGAEPDVSYLHRVRQAMRGTALLDDWCRPSSDYHLLNLQLEQVEEELLALFLVSQNQRRQLAVQRSLLNHLFSLFKRYQVFVNRLVRP